MSAYPADSLCECCGMDEAEIYADGEWLCPDCELEAAEPPDPILALELAEIYWGCTVRVIDGGKS